MGTQPETRILIGIDLRYVLTWQLVEADGVMRVRELVRSVEAGGFAVPPPVSKTVSDALRWEVRRGRVTRVARGRYRAGTMPRQTRSRIRHRVAMLRAGADRSQRPDGFRPRS